MKYVQRSIQSILIVLVLLYLLIYSAWQENSQYQDQKQMGSLYRSLVVIRTVDDMGVMVTGSGCIFDISEEKIRIATAAHVVEATQIPCEVLFCSGAVCQGETVSVNEEKDIALLEVPLEQLEEDSRAEELFPVNMDPAAYRRLKTNSEIFMIDIADSLEQAEVYHGSVIDQSKYLEEFGQKMIYANGSAKPGMSGTGVFDASGSYVGMLLGMTEYGEIAALPVPAIQNDIFTQK